MELGHWVTGSMGRLSCPGHQVTGRVRVVEFSYNKAVTHRRLRPAARYKGLV